MLKKKVTCCDWLNFDGCEMSWGAEFLRLSRRRQSDLQKRLEGAEIKAESGHIRVV